MEKERDNMTDDLKLPQVGELTLPQWQYWLARYNEVLTERDIRIEKLEAALREIIQKDALTGKTVFVGDFGKIAIAALGEKE